MKDAAISCVFRKAFELWLEGTSDNNIDLGETKMMNYCGKKRIIDNGLIDTTVFNITLNPDNLDVEGVDCDAVLKSKERIFMKQFYDLHRGDKQFNQDVFDCFVMKFEESKYFNRYMLLGIMSQPNLSDEEKAAEVHKLNDFMKELTDTAASCE